MSTPFATTAALPSAFDSTVPSEMPSGAGMLAVVTGASSGIGYELARCCAADGCDLVIAADTGSINEVAQDLRDAGARNVQALMCDLATADGVDRLHEALQGRPVDLLFANAGHGLGHAFLEQDFNAIRHVIDTNLTGTLDLIHRVGQQMLARGQGRILITGSIAGFTPGSFAAVYNGTKAFIDNFAAALRNELKDTGVSVTCLMPGATETGFFDRADMLDTKVGQNDSKDDPADVARAGYQALLAGDDVVIHGWKNKLQVASGLLMPSSVKAAAHRSIAEPGSGLS